MKLSLAAATEPVPAGTEFMPGCGLSGDATAKEADE